MRGVSLAPAYLLSVAVMVIVGIALASILADIFIPSLRQRGYPGGALTMNYRIGNGTAVIILSNHRDYAAKADIFILTEGDHVVSYCPNGTIRSSLGIARNTSGGFPLTGLEVYPHEIVTIYCNLGVPIKTIRYNEYGAPSAEGGEAFVGVVPSGISGGGTPAIPSWKYSFLYFRMPITVVSFNSYSHAYVELTLTPDTVPYDILLFVRTHTQPSLVDMQVTTIDGSMLPTKAERRPDGSIVVYFDAGSLGVGVHRYYLYFGNPDLEKTPKPLVGVPSNAAVIQTPIPLPNTIESSIAYPGYLVPEANWLPKIDDVKYPTMVIGDKAAMDAAYSAVANGEVAGLRSLLSSMQSNPAYYPIGTMLYSSTMLPKTDLGSAPWGVAAALKLPKLYSGFIAQGTKVYAKVWLSVDDGASAFVVSVSDSSVPYVEALVDSLYSSGSASYWRYTSPMAEVNVSKYSMGSPYLFVLAQNGICGSTGTAYAYTSPCGSGRGYLDFRFAMWYVESVTANPPPPSAFSKTGEASLEVTVHGFGVDLYNYTIPIRLSGRCDIDWNLFSPDSVYVIGADGNPLYYWVSVESGKITLWVRVPHVPASGTYTFKLYYGGVNKYPSYADPEKVFDFFDDFSKDPSQTGKWLIYSSSGGRPSWDSAAKAVVLADGDKSLGVAMFINKDWREPFHAHFQIYLNGRADGTAFAFFKDISLYGVSGAAPSAGGSLGLDVRRGGKTYKSPGYAVEFDLYRNSWRDPYTPHIALVETFSSADVSNNKHYKYYVRSSIKGQWHSIDIFYYGNTIYVYMDGGLVLSYGGSGSVFAKYGIRYGGMGFTAGTGGYTGTFMIKNFMLRRYAGREPLISTRAVLPSTGEYAEAPTPSAWAKATSPTGRGVRMGVSVLGGYVVMMVTSSGYTQYRYWFYAYWNHPFKAGTTVKVAGYVALYDTFSASWARTRRTAYLVIVSASDPSRILKLIKIADYRATSLTYFEATVGGIGEDFMIGIGRADSWIADYRLTVYFRDVVFVYKS